MIIVMPDGHPIKDPAQRSRSMEVFSKDLIGDVLPLIERKYRTAPGHVMPGTSAQHLMEGSPVSVGIAPAGLRAKLNGGIHTIAVPLAGPHNDVARETARALAEKLGATVVESPTEPVDLVVVGSAPGAPPGRVVVGGDVRGELASARSSVLVVPAESPVLP